MIAPQDGMVGKRRIAIGESKMRESPAERRERRRVVDDIFERLARCTGFERDEGNAPKIRARHGVTQGEC